MTDTRPEEKSKKERSTAYPSISLAKAIEYSKLLVEAYRKSPFSRQNAVDGMGYKKITGDTGQKVAALAYYGLLERSGTSYKNSEIAQRICYAPSEEARSQDIAHAAQTPKLFQTLIQEYASQGLPARLTNILITSHGINPNVADKVAENFKETLEYASLLVNGIVSSMSTEENTAEITNTTPPPVSVLPAGNNTQQPGRYVPPQHTTPHIPAGMQTLILPCGIVLSYPAELAYSFAIGKFAAEITALDKTIAKTINPKTPENDTNTDAPLQ